MLALDTVYHMKAEELLATLPDSTIDLIVTSPPYDNLRTYKGFEWDFELIARESYRVLKPGGVLVWVVGDAFIDDSESLTSFDQALYFRKYAGFNMHQRLIWQKQSMPRKRPNAYLPDFEDMFVFSKGTPKSFNPIFKRNKNAGSKRRKGSSGKHGFSYADGYRVTPDVSMLTNIWLVPVGGTNDDDRTGHPAVFPEELAERHILTWSNPGDTVLDYFGGSGTTAKMARQNGRRYLTCDISAEYVELMQKRLAQPFTVPMFAEQPIEQPKPTQNGLFDAIEGDKE